MQVQSFSLRETDCVLLEGFSDYFPNSGKCFATLWRERSKNLEDVIHVGPSLNRNPGTLSASELSESVNAVVQDLRAAALDVDGA